MKYRARGGPFEAVQVESPSSLHSVLNLWPEAAEWNIELSGKAGGPHSELDLVVRVPTWDGRWDHRAGRGWWIIKYGPGEFTVAPAVTFRRIWKPFE